MFCGECGRSVIARIGKPPAGTTAAKPEPAPPIGPRDTIVLDRNWLSAEFETADFDDADLDSHPVMRPAGPEPVPDPVVDSVPESEPHVEEEHEAEIVAEAVAPAPPAAASPVIAPPVTVVPPAELLSAIPERVSSPKPVAPSRSAAADGAADRAADARYSPGHKHVAEVPVAEAGSETEDDLEQTRIVPRREAGERFVLQFSTGESVSVYGTGLLGRNPTTQPGEFFDQIVSISDPSRSVSKTHLEFGQEGGAFWISDRYSGNGSGIREPDSPPKRCEPGRRYRVVRGTRVDIGEQFFIVS